MFKLLRNMYFIFCMIASHVAHSAEMVNVEYIHQLIQQHWGITIPYNPTLKNPMVAANMKYLLTTIDVANKQFNDQKITDYGNGEFATMVAADTIATNNAIATLIQIKPKFFVTTTPNTETFEFQISAKGGFLVDWGDDTTSRIARNNIETETYSHTYSAPGKYTIGIGGRATQYGSAAAISFRDNLNVAGISGSLGAIFGTISGTRGVQQPNFASTFSGCRNLSGTIPPNIFTGIYGAPGVSMFLCTFRYCSGLTGEIPAKMFGNLSGEPQVHMFAGTFEGCSNLSGPIPAGLFGNLYGNAHGNMFGITFAKCTNLTGCIPDGLFGNVGMTLDEIITEYDPIRGTGVAATYCSEM